jgi:hypothetical protein
VKSVGAFMRGVTVVARKGDESAAAIAPRHLLYLAAEKDPLTAPQQHRYVFNHTLPPTPVSRSKPASLWNSDT